MERATTNGGQGGRRQTDGGRMRCAVISRVVDPWRVGRNWLLEKMPRRASYLDKDESRIYKRALPEVGGRTCIVVPPFGENSAS